MVMMMIAVIIVVTYQCSVRQSVPSSVFETLIVSLVLTKLDFGNATLAGLLTNLLNRLQSVLNAAARSIAGLRHSDHLTDTLVSFHWLRASERISFKLAVLVFRALHGTAPRYLSDFLRLVADLPSRRRLRSATSSQLDVRPSRLVHLPLLGQSSGTVSLMTLHRLHRYIVFSATI